MTIAEAKGNFQDLETGRTQDDRAHVRNRSTPGFSFRPITKHVLQLITISLVFSILLYALHKPITKISRKPTACPLPKTYPNSENSNFTTCPTSYNMGLSIPILGSIVILSSVFLYVFREHGPLNAFLDKVSERRRLEKDLDFRRQMKKKVLEHILEEGAKESEFRRRERMALLNHVLEEQSKVLDHKRWEELEGSSW